MFRPLLPFLQRLGRYPIAAGVTALAVIAGGGLVLATSHPTTTQAADASLTVTVVDTATLDPNMTPTATTDPLATPTATSLIATATPAQSSTAIPGATATATLVPTLPPAPTDTPMPTAYKEPTWPSFLAISPTTLNGQCAAGKLPQITITDTGDSTHPIGWTASASPHVDLNPGNSNANGTNPMTPGSTQYLGFSFGAPLQPGTVITITVNQTQYSNPEMTYPIGTITVNCQ